MPQGSKYTSQRTPKNPPHVSLHWLRKVAKLDLKDVAIGVGEVTGKIPTVGAISAIENGHRGASPQMLAALETVYDLPPGTIAVDYEPRVAKGEVGEFSRTPKARKPRAARGKGSAA